MSEYAVVNPKRKRRSSKRRSSKRRAVARAVHHNPAPKRRRRRRSSGSFASARRRRVYRNPSASLMGLDLMQVGIGVGGAGLAALGVNFGAKYLPAGMQGPVGNAALKVGGYLAAAQVAKMVAGKQAAKTVLFAGALIEGFQLFKQYVGPSIGLSGIDDEFQLTAGVSSYVDTTGGMAGVGGAFNSPF